MGTDIHLAVEVRRNGQWERALPPEEARSPWLVSQAAEQHGPGFLGSDWYAARARVEWYDGRNYRLFAVLADVQNGYGFAGVPTGDAVRPIASPKGLPADLSPELMRLADRDNDVVRLVDPDDDVYLGDHSQSWLTLAELQAYDWDARVVTLGVVTLEQFMARVLKHGPALPLEGDEPPYDNWSGGVSGRTIKVYPAAEVLRNPQGFAVPVGVEAYVQDSWSIPLRVQVGDWCTRVMPALATLGAPDDVRIVFGFDS